MKPITEVEQLAVPVGKRDNIQGRFSAPLTIVEYGDYECPACGMAYPVVKAVQERLGDRLRFVFRNFPLTQVHPHAEHAAEAAEAAGTRDAFWPMHDMLFENQDALEDEDLAEHAATLGLAAPQVLAEIQSGVHAKRVRDDFMSGVKSGVNGTPTFFINGVRHDGGYDLQHLLAALEEAAQEE